MLLYPRPKRVSESNDSAARPPSWSWTGPSAPSPRLTEFMEIHGLPRSDAAFLHLSLAEDLPRPSSYHLRIGPEAITLQANSEPALAHGVTTLLQIIAQSQDRLPCLEIEDWPDLAVRGYMLDISRCKVPTLHSLRALVDCLAALKYNQLQLYMEHTFAYREHQIVWQEASPLTADEIQTLDTYCHARYIDLVPNQNSFGHMERWLRHAPYKPLAESPDGFHHPFFGWKDHGTTLKPDDASLDFVDALHAELLPNFRSRAFNVGGDEPWELGQGWSKPLVEQRGKQRVYLDFLLKLHQRVSALGRHMQFWGDIVLEKPELARELPQDLTALLWGYEADHPFPEQCAAIREAGLPFYVVPGTSTWNTVGGRLANALANIDAATRNAIEHSANGCLLTDWGDHGHHQPACLSILPIVAAAGRYWHCQAIDQATIDSVATSLIPRSLTPDEIAAIRQLGACGDGFAKRLHNATWLNKILFAKPETLRDVLENVTREELEQARERVESVNVAGSTRIDQELQVSKELLAFACAKGLAALSQRPLPALPAELVSRFRDNWLARNRPGGLEESVGNLILPNASRP